MGHYTEIPVPIPVLSLFSFLRPEQNKMIFKNRFCYPVPYLFLLLLPGRWNDWGLVWGLWVTILKSLSGPITFPLHSLSYSIINLVLGHYIECYTTGLLGMTWGLGYILCLTLSSGHYTDVLFSFRHYIDLLFSLFWPIRVTILENFRAVWGLTLNSSVFPGNSFKIPLGGVFIP